MTFNSVNQYCLDHIVGLSEQKEVLAAEDIFDERGVKLWAKGNRVSRDLQEKLLKRKLAKPLETALTVEDAVSFASVIDDALLLLGKHPLLDKIAGHREAILLLQGMRNVILPPPVRLLLTATREKQRTSFDHNLYTLLLVLGIGARLKISDHDAQTLLLASLLHDLGEMYINPDYLHSPTRLAPKDWKYVAAHPTIGRMLIQEMTNLPPAVGDCVAMHHERLDGSGYPNHLDGSRQNRLGALLAVADSTAAIVARDGASGGARVGLALRIVPEEFDRGAVSVIATALRDSGGELPGCESCDCVERAQQALRRLDRALLEASETAGASQDSFIRKTGAEVALVLGNLRKSMRATGVVDAGQLGTEIDEPHLKAEICQVIKEVEWRMRNLARNIHLRAENHRDGQPMLELAGVIEALDLESEPAPPA